ncbi:MAG: GGDEF domain-containing protein [Azoarcus sp.]|jgi:diguanylate cyclase|nr:GGDEF domain-containing protein [Azoarcus sp.]
MKSSQSIKPHRPASESRHGGADADAPSELARETLRQLALRKEPPTPDNYRELYFQIRGTADEDIFPARALRAIAAALPRVTPAELRSVQAFDAAIASGQWPELHRVIADLHSHRASDGKAWDTLIRDLILQFERLHAELTQARKREALNHVLEARPSADILHERLSSLVRSWSQYSGAPPASGDAEALNGAAAGTPETPGATIAPETPLRPLLARLLTNGVAPLAGNDEPLSNEARALSATLLGGGSEQTEIASRLEQLITRMEWVGEERNAVREALLSLLRLIVDNIRELVIDDNWLHGQLTIIAETFAGPLSLRMLDDVGQQLREVINKQGHLKRGLAEAQDHLKEMLVGFIDRLSEVTVSTGDYHDLLGRSARRIGEATNIADLSEVVGELLAGTRQAQESTLRAGQELSELRERVDNANHEIARLQNELDAASRLVRHDPLTGVLNRKGLDEALTREISRVHRKGTPLSVALIDIDNFKKFNDVYGHTTGDEALCHLTRTVTETLRPQDVVARYGGEEFIILLPDTSPEAANTILMRLQRELTRRIFCAPDSERLLITFSAGIAQLSPSEQPEDTIARADEAMYAAKRAGKNRVLVAV